ncbi:MAG: T9SS type A sorting domain-containing protein, partial [Hymenobacter sp.]
YTLAVYDGQGRLVQQVASGQAAAEQAQEVAVPTATYAAGLYLVRLTMASGVQTLKLVKQ